MSLVIGGSILQATFGGALIFVEAKINLGHYTCQTACIKTGRQSAFDF
jgi:hypothetical protein